MTAQEAIEKVAKLLRLAQSDNAHEAALAASRAQEIMDRYQLTGTDLNLDGGKPTVEETAKVFQTPLWDDGGRNLSTWVMRLAMSVAYANQCKVYSCGARIFIVGCNSDADTTRYLFAYLQKEVDRLAHRDARGEGKSYANNFRIGCVETIGQALRAQRKATVEAVKAEVANNPSALVLVTSGLARIERHAEITRKVYDAIPGMRSRQQSRTNYDHEAREAGRRAGREVAIGGARSGLGAGHKALAS